MGWCEGQVQQAQTMRGWSEGQEGRQGWGGVEKEQDGEGWDLVFAASQTGDPEPGRRDKVAAASQAPAACTLAS